MLRSLHLKDVGPAARFDLDLGERLNVLTGDNGLGKSFVLDVAWWALTGSWVDRPMLPQSGKEDSAEIVPNIAWGGKEPARRTNVDVPKFNRVLQEWGSVLTHGQRDRYQGHNQINVPSWLLGACPVLSLRANGVFALWDPARNHQLGSIGGWRDPSVLKVLPFVFDEAKLWNGLDVDGRPLCNGLIQDWVSWQLEAQTEEGHPFHLLASVLAALSHPDEQMTPGKPVRLYLDDARRIPTIVLPYETIPVVHASSGMKRILGLAYLLTWTWTEHVRASSMMGWNPAERIVVLFEEPETNLHPRWQRHILPALLHVLEGLGAGVKPQMLVTTHSPLVLASLETEFDLARDKQFLFELVDRQVTLRELPWAKRGDAVSWLTSDVFGLEQGGSIPADRAIEAAHRLIEGDTADLADGLRTEEEIDRELQRVLPEQHPFLADWYAFRKHKIA